MKRILSVLAVALCLPFGMAQADMLTGGTFLQVPFGLNTHITPTVNVQPTIGFRLWNEFKGFRFGFEGTTFVSDLSLDSNSTSGWGAAAYLRVRTWIVGNLGLLHLMAKGGTSSPGTWNFSLDDNQFSVGPVALYQPGARKNEPSGWGGELGVFWMSAKGTVSQLGVQAQLVVDVQ